MLRVRAFEIRGGNRLGGAQGRRSIGRAMARGALTLAICLGWGLILPHDLPAQQLPGPAVEDPSSEGLSSTARTAAAPQQIVRAYQLSRKAQSAEQLAEALALCHQIDARSLAQQQQAYLQQLKSWIHNRRGEVFAQLAEQAVRDEDLAEADNLEAAALAEFHAALKSDANNWQAHHNRGVSLATLGQLQEALADFDAAISLHPSYANAWFNRAEIYYQLGQLDRAETDYGQVLQLDAQDAGAYEGRAHVRHELQKYDLALEDYNALLTLQPDNAQSLLERADLQALRGAWQQAAHDYRSAIRLDPKLAKAYQNAAWMMATCPDPRFRNAELALKAAQRALDLLAEDATHHSWDTWAAALAAAGRYDEAAQASQQALALAPAGVQGEIRVRLAGYQQRQAYQQQPVQTAAYQQPTLHGPSSSDGSSQR